MTEPPVSHLERPETDGLLEEIREQWRTTEGARSLFHGPPHEEVEAYFRFSYFQLTARMLMLESVEDKRKALLEIQQIRNELTVCFKAFDYLVKALGSKP